MNKLSKYTSKFFSTKITLEDHPIIGFDTEDDSKGTPVLFAFYGDFPGQKFVTKYVDEALKFIWDVEEPSIFIAHNLEYDIANLFKDSNYLMVDKMIYSSVLLRVDLYGTKHYCLNSTQFFKGPLAKMAKFVGLEKLEGDPLNPDYCLRDAEIVYQFVKKFQTRLHTEAGVNLGITIGKMAMDTYRSHYMTDKKQVTYNSPNCIKAYYGGRVEIFKMGLSKNIQVVDINSCYPHVMRNFEYPDTATIEAASIKTHKFGIGEFTINVPSDTFLPVLPYKSSEGRLFFPTGIITGWWTYPEVRHAVEQGASILKEHEGEGTNVGCNPFRGFIDAFYLKRQECKARLLKNPDDVEAIFDSLFYKYWLNNLYGKWCQRKDSAEMTRDKWPWHKLEKALANPDFKTNKIGPFYNYVIPRDKLPATSNFMWGIYVTSYSRIYLHKGLQSVVKAGHTLLYTDTDSIMYSPVDANIPFNITEKLGDYSIEKFDLGIFRQSKGYLLCDKEGNDYKIKKVACKGVPTKFAYDFIIDGMAKFFKPYRLKEALIRVNAKVNTGKDKFLKEVGENVWHEISKHMKSIYIKRRGRGVTYPVDVLDIPDLELTTLSQNKSIQREMVKNAVTVKKDVLKSNFENTIVPVRYFDGKRTAKGKARLCLSQKLFHLRGPEQCLELKRGQIWFTGDVLQIRTNPNGKQLYQVFIDNFKGKKLLANFWGQLPISFFDGYGITENLLNKKVEIKIDNNYTENGSLDLSIKISESKLKGQIGTELIDNENELTEKQLKTLMSLDWSSIVCKKE